MAGSESEEVLRAKGVALLRRQYPDARIIHELMLSQGGCRIDLAAVTPDLLVVVEIKSAKDTLKRLPAQIREAVGVADRVIVIAAAKHAEGISRMMRWYLDREEGGGRNPDHLQELAQCTILIDRGEEALTPMGHRIVETFPQAKDRFYLLWADEMRSALGRHFGGADMSRATKMDRAAMVRQAVEHMSGRECRRAVCEQLRNRPFPRADARAGEAPC